MIPLYRDPLFTFRFEEDRLIDRFHLEGVRIGTSVTVWRWQPLSPGQSGEMLAQSVAGEDGWVTLQPPLVMRAGEGFVAGPSPAPR